MHPSISLQSQTEVESLVDAHLRHYLQERKLQAGEVSSRYVIFWNSIESLLLAGGKRFRPYMLLTAYAAYAPEADTADILPAALAQELLHAAMLIHDDIIDRDTLRYGVKNVAGQYDDTYKAYIEPAAEREHFSSSMALLAGDMLLSDAHQLLRMVDRPADVVAQAATIMSRSIFEVIGGELLDTEAAILPAGAVSAERVARYKTAGYSFVSPLTMGATLAGAPPSEIAHLTELSEYLGIGYQLRDDLLGVFGDSQATGKSTSTDITEGKRTVLVETFETCATPHQKERFAALFHRSDITEAELNEIRELLKASGAEAAVNERIATLHDQAATIVAQLAISEPARQSLTELVTHCLKRKA